MAVAIPVDAITDIVGNLGDGRLTTKRAIGDEEIAVEIDRGARRVIDV